MVTENKAARDFPGGLLHDSAHSRDDMATNAK